MQWTYYKATNRYVRQLQTLPNASIMTTNSSTELYNISGCMHASSPLRLVKGKNLESARSFSSILKPFLSGYWDCTVQVPNAGEVLHTDAQLSDCQM